MQPQQNNPLIFSCEFFPPKGEENASKLRRVRRKLARIHPRYYSVTFGAGGSTRDRTFETILEIQAAAKETGIEAAPHLSCVGSSRKSIREVLQAYQHQGVKRLVTLRGDLPSGMVDPGDFHYASQLVEFIRAETGDYFHIEVAAYPEVHPQARSAQADLINFKHKVEAGADSAITQYFYNVDAYLRFVERCKSVGIDLPIVPGIMPINNYVQLARFSDACGAEIPRWLRKRLEDFPDPATMSAFAIDVVSDLCYRLLEAGAPGLHFYTLNRADPTLAIWDNLGLETQPANLSAVTKI
ncbi:methylenetetrahydrofolate reductase [NAD(P)H] [Nitrosococcus oceani]|uniref:Methylenetetrahydrofolate reductase n=2 Tax=Nitrosococcus oceani TaxID=1229 RepID=Q3J7R3_NITOC|nr:methylenetetrahydrofolate reductase [NAD(P)H] [Nitrosococcus oceani]KFI18456.1 5,10-methylenetetrahydrofolate reductase [Nitrosococcus oceani C-27]ABA59133.1 5,10-methylenetetrahydrofolate reductase [Nitrosococcus oceani ATCC 19707]EDZ66049.1 5,10-methylenetetrahydrofolate reductase [Nitrosococcus oceani AFC27]KFI21692.1 5,10-methylenetetrahydrofolate reductase [Nitrosococcus oceani]GEM20337.1 methylenetetrahydrofolate reductase [NAD(P)H] [Nitrosococcus oceani]